MGKLNLNAMQEKLNNVSSSSGYSSTEYDKLQTGKNVRRILFPKGSSDSFYSEGFLHFSLGEDGHKVVTCPKTFSSKNPCPVCEYVEELKKSKNKDDKKLASAIGARRRIYVNVLNRDASDEEDTPKVLAIGVTVLKGLLETICDADYGDITDFEDGRDVTITKKGTGLDTEYSVLPKPKSSVASEDLTEEQLDEKMADLDALFVKKSYDEIKAILNGEEEDSDSEDDDADDENDSESDSYDDMSLEELEDACKELGIKLPVKPNRIKLISLLEKYEEEVDDEDDEEQPFDEEDIPVKSKKRVVEDDEDDEDEDSIKDAITDAIARRKRSSK